MKQISAVKTVLKLAPLALAVSCSLSLLSGCSSSSSSSSSDASISGTIVAAPVDGAKVRVVDGNGNTVAGPVTTSATGQYTLSIPNGSLAQDLIVKATGGTFTDEATGNAGTVGDGEMFAYTLADSLSDGSSVSVTPGSTIIAELVMNHGKSMTEAQEAFANAFGYTPDASVTPADATTAPAEGADDASILAGFRAATFSQLAMDLGLSQDDQFEMFVALAQDLSDGALDGVDTSGAVDIGATGSALEANIQNSFATAMVNFHASGYNLTGLDNNQIGNLPFGKIAFTDSYQIKYMQMGEMGAMDGKSTFQIHITDRDSGAGVAGLMPMLMPMMHMENDMNHSSPKPVDSVTDDGDGYYTVTLYYVMASQMMDGMSMGYWDLKFTTVDDEVAHFYPTVMMAMADMDTIQVRLKGIMDKVMGMDAEGSMSMVSRPYFIFKEDLEHTGMGLYNFSVFIAARESMMSFPALVDGKTLNDGEMYAYPIVIATTEVSVSANGGAWSPPIATDGTDGIWTAIDLPLNAGEENQIRIKLTVSGDVKTTDGAEAVLDTNDYQTFTLTPGMAM